MALLFIEGFEVVPANMLNIKWGSVNLTTPIQYWRGRKPKSQCLRIVGTSLTSQQFSNANTYVCGFAFLWSGFTQSNTIFQFRCASDIQVSLTFNFGTQTLQVNSGNTVLGLGSTILLPNTWYYVELKTTIDPSTGSYTLRINGATDITASNLSTRAVSLDGNVINGISFQGAAGGGMYFLDDIYLLDTTGTTNNDFLGDMTVEGLVVNHQGDHNQWTAAQGENAELTLLNWQAVASLGGNDVLSQTVNNADSYGISQLQAINTTVAGVSVHYIGRNDGIGTHSITPITRVNGTDYAQPSQSFTSTSNQLLTSIMDKNPSTSAAWTPSDFHDIQFGMVLAS